MNVGFWLSILLGLGVAGHALVGTVLTTRLSGLTESLWSRFGARTALLRRNGLLLVVASVLHLGLSVWKAAGTAPAVFLSSVLPFVPFAAAGILERLGRTAWPHHALMAAGWLLFAWHGSVAAG